MRIECPSCSAAYDVPDSLMSPGRVVRCARCGGEWSPVAAAAAPPQEPPPAPESEPEVVMAEPLPVPVPASAPPPPSPVVRLSAMERLAAHPAWPQPSHRLRFAWAASIAVLVLGAGAAFAWRSQIVEVWPPSARAYALFGLQPQARAQQ